MAVYVDEIRPWPLVTAPALRAGTCHLTADSVDELHRFADDLGLPRSWYQPRSRPHYDLTAKWRLRALRQGAEFVTAREQALRRIAARQARPLTPEAATASGAAGS